MTLIAVIPASLLLILLGACGPPPAPSTPESAVTDTAGTTADAPIDLRFAGSDSLGKRLIPALLEAFIASRGGRTLQWIDDDGGGRQLRVRDGGATSGPRHIAITGQSSAAAFQALARGEADIGMASRLISASELFTLSSIGDFKDVRSEHLIAFDGVAVIVNAANPVDALTVEQIRGILSCRIIDWSQAGGLPGAINVYVVDHGTQNLDAFTLPLQTSPRCTAARQILSTSQLSEAVTADPSGIAIVNLSSIGDARAVKIVECDQTAYAPNAFTVRSREYPWIRPLYLYTPARPDSPFVHDFIDFVLSPEGQEIVHREGFVSLAVRPDLTDPQDRRLREAALSIQDPGVLGELVRFTRGASRLAVTFRFESFDLLDELGRSDLDRLARFMESPAAQGKELMLLGFADASGPYRNSLERSKSRAETVARALAERGVNTPMVKGFGEEAPVACNSDESGRARNRRVEVWIR